MAPDDSSLEELLYEVDDTVSMSRLTLRRHCPLLGGL